MHSDLTISPDLFIGPPPAAALESNHKLVELQGLLPNWVDVGAATYRQMREEGKTALPKPVYAPDAIVLPDLIPSRDAGRHIPARLLLPDGQARGQQPGLVMHIHGGGWVLMHEGSQDAYLKQWANRTGCAVLSIGYRLAPENPFPAGPNDCYDAAEWLVDHAAEASALGAPLLFVGGESAGGHLSAQVTLHLLKARPAFRFRGALLNYGCFNLSTPFPSSAQFRFQLVLPRKTIDQYLEAFVPGKSEKERADPAISPFWHPVFDWNNDLSGVGPANLPPALFICGTLDPLLDDTLFMSVRWQAAGAAAPTRIFRGLPHGFNLFPDEQFPGSAAAMDAQIEFMTSHMKDAKA